jgi:hypothetical protein
MPPAIASKTVLPILLSTITQSSERQSIATHIALLDKTVVLKRKKIFLFIIKYNFTKTRAISHNEACVIGEPVSGYR